MVAQCTSQGRGGRTDASAPMICQYRRIVSLLLCTFGLAASAPALTIAEITDITPKADEIPSPVKTIAPEYPANLRKDKVSGLVSVMIVIDEKGEVMAAEVSKTTNDEFREPALDAIRRWRFKPAKLEGKAVKFRVTVPVRFMVE